MVNIIIYSTDKIKFDKLKSFKYNDFTLTVYGVLNDKWFFVYGNYDIKIYKPGQKRYKDVKAFEHITKKAVSSAILLKICDTFGEHIGSKNTDIEVEGIGNGNLIKFIKQTNIISSLPSGESIAIGEKNILYRY